MRDDIHRRLPLPRRWKSLVRVAHREAERPSWGKHARNAAAFELAQFTPALLAAAMGICAVLTMDELAGIADRVEQRNAEIVELAAALREPIETIRVRLGTLIRAFRSEWRAFLAQLPEASWIHSLTFHGAA